MICGIGSLLALGIPLFLLIRMGLKKDRQPLSKNTKISLSVIWAIGFILGATSAGRIINLATEQDRQRNIRWNQERKERREKEQRLLDENQSQDENADWDDIADWGELAYPQSDDDSQTADSSTTSKAPTAATDSDPHKKSTKSLQKQLRRPLSVPLYKERDSGIKIQDHDKQSGFNLNEDPFLHEIMQDCPAECSVGQSCIYNSIYFCENGSLNCVKIFRIEDF